MSISIDFEDATEETKKQISKLCTVQRNRTMYEPEPVSLYCYSVDDVTQQIHIPIARWNDFFEEYPNLEKYRKYSKTKFSFTGELYTIETDPKKYRDQDVVVEQAIKKLTNKGYCFLAAGTGLGKTCWTSELPHSLIGSFFCWANILAYVSPTFSAKGLDLLE